MSRSYLLPAALVGAALAIVQPAVQAASVEQVAAIARQVSVRIMGQAAPGSGVIIARQGSTYYVLTAEHVIRGTNSGDDAELVTADGQTHRINTQSIKSFPDADLAVVEFTSNQTYTVATLSTYDYRVYENREYTEAGSNSSYLGRSRSGQSRAFLFVAGWPLEGASGMVFNPGSLVDTSASAIANPAARYKSYELVYTNLTYRGMSGGPVLDTQGRLVGIHGRADGRGLDDSNQIVRQFLQEVGGGMEIKIGLSLGIPIKTFLQLAPRLGLTLPLKVETSAPAPLSQVDISRSWRPQIAVGDSNPLYWLEQGNQLWRIGQMQQAQDSFDRASKMLPDFYLPWFAKGFVYGFGQQYTDALAACNRSIEKNPDPDYYDGWRCKAGALQYLNQYPTALDALNWAMQIQERRRLKGDPEAVQNPSDWVARAELLFAMQQFRGSLQALDQAADIRAQQSLPDSPRLHNSRALVLANLEQYESALADLEIAVRLDPAYATAWSNRGLILRRLKRLPEALQAYQKAIDLNPNDPNSWNNQGTALYEAGQYEAALQSFERAIQLAPGYAPAIENRDEVKRALGR